MLLPTPNCAMEVGHNHQQLTLVVCICTYVDICTNVAITVAHLMQVLHVHLLTN